MGAHFLVSPLVECFVGLAALELSSAQVWDEAASGANRGVAAAAASGDRSGQLVGPWRSEASEFEIRRVAGRSQRLAGLAGLAWLRSFWLVGLKNRGRSAIPGLGLMPHLPGKPIYFSKRPPVAGDFLSTESQQLHVLTTLSPGQGYVCLLSLYLHFT